MNPTFKNFIFIWVSVLIAFLSMNALVDILHSTTMTDKLIVSFGSLIIFVVYTMITIYNTKFEIERLNEKISWLKDDLEALNKSLTDPKDWYDSDNDDELGDLNKEDMELHVKTLNIHCDKINYINDEDQSK